MNKSDLDKRIDDLKLILQPKGGGGGRLQSMHFPENCGLSGGGGGCYPRLSEAQSVAKHSLEIIQQLQAELAARDLLLTECEELLSRFDASVLTPISRSMYSDLMYKLITKEVQNDSD